MTLRYLAVEFITSC